MPLRAQIMPSALEIRNVRQAAHGMFRHRYAACIIYNTTLNYTIVYEQQEKGTPRTPRRKRGKAGKTGYQLDIRHIGACGIFVSYYADDSLTGL